MTIKSQVMAMFFLLEIAVVSVSIYLWGLDKPLQALSVLLTMSIIITLACIRRINAKS